MKKAKKKARVTRQSTYLFPMPSGIFGVGRFLDFGATFDTYNSSESEAEADKTAIYSDWKAVGDDLRRSIAKQLRTHRKSAKKERKAA